MEQQRVKTVTAADSEIPWKKNLGIASVVAVVAVVLFALLLVASCGGEGGSVGGGDNATTLASLPPGTTVNCIIGDNNTFNFTTGDNVALSLCDESGGTVTPDNSTNNTDSGNRTNVNGPTPTPIPIPTPTPGA